jgi:hypothetical protein
VSLGLEERAVATAPARWRPLARVSWAAAALAATLAVTSAVLAVRARDLSGFVVPVTVAYAAMGSVLLARRPGHPVGPLLCLIGLAIGLAGFTFAYSRYTVVHAPGSLPFSTVALWAVNWDSAPAIGLVGLILPLVFPDGRLLSPRWRPALWAAVAFIPLLIAGMAFSGPVIPIAEVDRLFQPFQRLGTRRARGDGHGLGLSIVRAIAGAHGAIITAHALPDGGLAITVSFGRPDQT